MPKAKKVMIPSAAAIKSLRALRSTAPSPSPSITNFPNMPLKRGGLKKGEVVMAQSPPLPETQAIIDEFKEGKGVGARVKTAESISSAFVVYIVQHSNIQKSPQITICKIFEAAHDAVVAFRAEYHRWNTSHESEDGEVLGMFPQQHTDKQLKEAYLINILEMSKRRDATPASLIGVAPAFVYDGRGKVEYTLFHRDDFKLKDDDGKKRRITIVCEETRFEAF